MTEKEAQENGTVVDNPREVSESPITSPVLSPQLWSKVFENLLPKDLVTVINSTPEWTKMLHSQKPQLLFPMVSKACPRDWTNIFGTRLKHFKVRYQINQVAHCILRTLNR